MTTWLYLQCVAMFILGQAFMLFLFKIPELIKLYKKANEGFNWSLYWKGDWYIIIGTQVLGCMLILGLDEIFHWRPNIIYWIKWGFGLVGAIGTEIAVSKLSSAKKYIMNVIDTKTNIADGKV
jgi:hypothetical protein